MFGLPTAAVMLRMLLKHKEKMAALRAPREQSSIDARLQRVEQAMDAVAHMGDMREVGRAYANRYVRMRDFGALL